MKIEAEWSHEHSHQSCMWLEMKSLLELPEGVSLCQHLKFEISPSRTVRKTVLKATQCVVTFFAAATGKQYISYITNPTVHCTIITLYNFMSFKDVEGKRKAIIYL